MTKLHGFHFRKIEADLRTTTHIR